MFGPRGTEREGERGRKEGEMGQGEEKGQDEGKKMRPRFIVLELPLTVICR